MNGNDVILTGLPRSGTTLSCFLLNKAPNTIALHEPMDVREFPTLGSHEAVADRIAAFFAQNRQSLLTRKAAISKHRGGAIPDNPVAGHYTPGLDLREGGLAKGEVTIDKPLSPDFCLVLKHPAAFTALLPTLKKRFRCFAVIRNPLSVLCSWASVVFTHRTGHAPAAENLNADLKASLAGIEDEMQRRLHLLSWFFQQYAEHLPDCQILRYERIIQSRGQALGVITPFAQGLDETLQSKNNNKLYDPQVKAQFGEALLNSQGAYWQFYQREDVAHLLQ